MLLYNKNGKLIEINRLDYSNDKLYYSKIMQNKVNISIPINRLKFSRK